MEDQEYNYIYSKLVKDKNDILGIIAYSIYKRQKIEFLNKYKAEHDGEEAPREEAYAFKELSNSDTQLEFYKTQSVHLANEFLEEMLSETLEDAEKDFSSRVHRELVGIKHSFWSGVFQSLVGSVLFVLFAGIIVFFSWSANQGTEKVIESIFNVEIIEK